jgi:aminopeptidase
MDRRIEKMAEVLIKYSLGIKEGDYLFIEGSSVSEPLIKEGFRQAVREGALVENLVHLEGVKEIFLKNASEKQLAAGSKMYKYAFENMTAFLYIWGHHNTKEFAGVDPSRMAAYVRSQKDWRKVYGERTASGEMRWVGTQFPTLADAQEAGMSLSEYEDFVYKACLVDQEDPIGAWKKIHDEQQRIVDYLDTKDVIHVISKDTDLTYRVKGRKWINCDGKVNFPDGEVYTGPIEDSVEGHIRFSFPGIYLGNEIEDIELTFKKGKVVKSSARRGESFLNALLDTDEGSRQVGECAIGTNYSIDRFTRNMLFDEKIGGTIHLAVGYGFKHSGSKSVSSLHWDMLCDMRDGGEIYADGELFYKDGKFLK